VPGTQEPLTGTPDEIAEHLRAFARQGITHMQITPRIPGVAGVRALGRVLEILDRDSSP
jgi:alkanesulfonate monooxygenase SsuD/methylene tetrahydromethanopterin reductase-like flavin-dependent oxidoreductase (luciferase family)